MHINDFTFTLPNKQIAIHPPLIRGNSKLLILNKNDGSIEHSKYSNFDQCINPGDVIVVNDTRVIKARIMAKCGAKTRELVLLERHSNAIDVHKWKALHKGKVHEGEIYQVGDSYIKIGQVHDNGIADVSCDDDIIAICSKYGDVPLPPYMHRSSNKQDIERYQTEFAKTDGSVAAPTASLNLTNHLIRRITSKGGVVAFITLHVGLGTFLPIRTEVIEQHEMHSEYFEVPSKTIISINEAKTRGNRIFAVGTTVTRTLEYLYKTETPKEKDCSGEADIFIYPGYKFGVVDAMITNFHAPKSTVLMMASAFAGWNNLMHAYEVALANDYKFLSYGDSMLII